MKSLKTVFLFAPIITVIVVASACGFSSINISIPTGTTVTPTIQPTPQLSTNIPTVVDGVIVDKPSRDWDGTVLEMFRLTVRTMTGVTYTVPVDVETYVRAWWDQSIRLDCSEMPCVREGLVTGVVVDAPQSAYIVVLKRQIDGAQQTYDVDPVVSTSVKIGQTITLDCKDAPCVFAEGEGQ